MSQHKATLRKSLRSALRHKSLADKILNDVLEVQTKLNAAMDKLDADDGTALAVDYAATVDTEVSDYDSASVDVQHKADMRKALVNALSHKRAANEIVDSVEELSASMNALMVKLDAEAGTLASLDFESSLGVVAIDADEVSIGQHKASMRKSIISALSHKKLANEIVNAISGAQSALNAVLAQLDVDAAAGTAALVGLYDVNKVEAINPDQD